MTAAAPGFTLETLNKGKWRTRPDLLGARLRDEGALPLAGFIRARHIRYLGQRIMYEVMTGGGRLVINIPPQYGKSTLASVLTPLWYLHLSEGRGRVLLGSYEASFAEVWGRRVRDLVAAHAGLLEMRLRPDVHASNGWETTAGGGMWTAGVGGSMTGRPADLVLVDDPHKNLADARSRARNEEVWDWYTTVMRTRLAPGGSMILIQTRWTPNDLTGRILEASATGAGEHYDVVRLPAIAEEPSAEYPDADPLGRLPGELLFPERYDLDEVAAERLSQSKLGWAGLYQQRPTVAEGDVLRRADWGRVDTLPAVPVVAMRSARRGLLMVRRWDLAASAASEGGDPDWTVGALCVWDETASSFFVVDIVRGQWSSGQVREVVLAVAEDDAAAWGGRGQVAVRGETEPGSSGKRVGEDWEADLSAYPVKWLHSTGSKETRAEPLVAAQQNHRCFLVRGTNEGGVFATAEWWPEFLDEAAAFPNGSHDDQVDAVAAAYNDLSEMARIRKRRKGRLTATAGQTVAANTTNRLGR